MDEYLQHCKNINEAKIPSVIVLGNESCDLDSTVCSIALAFHYHKNPEILKDISPLISIYPVLNIRRSELALKTEVVYTLKRYGIDPNQLICRDETALDDEDNQIYKLILVDHHVTKYYKLVVAVVDHRPFDTDTQLDDDVKSVIQEVGSCATLVTDLINDANVLKTSDPDYDVLTNLLYAAIVLDTVNFSIDADKARELDYQMAAIIQKYLRMKPMEVESYRRNLFESLVYARSNVNSLNSLQLLSKDLKFVNSLDNGIVVAVPGYPILVQEYIKKSGAERSLKKFALTNNCDVIVMVGMKVTEGKVRRDIGIINIKHEELFEDILSGLTNSADPDFGLEEIETDFYYGRFFEQTNMKVSRKQLIPLIKELLG